MKVTNLKPVLTRYDGGETSRNAGAPDAEQEGAGLPSPASSANRPSSLLSGKLPGLDPRLARLVTRARQRTTSDVGLQAHGLGRVAGSAAIQDGHQATLDAGADLKAFRALQGTLSAVTEMLKPENEGFGQDQLRDALCSALRSALSTSTHPTTHPERFQEFTGVFLSQEVRSGRFPSKHATILDGALSPEVKRRVQLAFIEKGLADDLAGGTLEAGGLDDRCQRASLSDEETAQVRRGVLETHLHNLSKETGDRAEQSLPLGHVAAACGLNDFEAADLVFRAAVAAYQSQPGFDLSKFVGRQELTKGQRGQVGDAVRANSFEQELPELAGEQWKDHAPSPDDPITFGGVEEGFAARVEKNAKNFGIGPARLPQLKAAAAEAMIRKAVADGLDSGEGPRQLADVADRISGELGFGDPKAKEANRERAARAYIRARLSEIGPGDLAKVISDFRVDDPELAEGVRVDWAEAVMASLPLDVLTNEVRDMLTRDAGVTWPSSMVSIQHEHQRVRDRKAADA